MDALEFLARREAIGMSQSALADWLGVAQSTVSNWEKGRRGIPDGVDADLEELELRVLDLADQMIDACLMVGDAAALISFTDDASLAAAHPEMDGWPAALHRVACARAAAELRVEGHRVRIFCSP